MKLLIITSLREYQEAVAQILERAGVKVFSASETTGFKNVSEDNLADNWFARTRDRVESTFLFSFTRSENATRALNLIRQFNEENQTGFPVRAFVVPVENASDLPEKPTR
jgi:hypothetical protein